MLDIKCKKSLKNSAKTGIGSYKNEITHHDKSNNLKE
jgi:hypothetical protein